jgi:Fic family protein
MMSFRGTRLENMRLPLSIVWLLETLAESKGRQQLYEKQAPQMLKSLGETALIESAESSNRIEGVTVERNRLRPLVIGKSSPRDRSEEEIVGYRMALNWIHADSRKIPVTPETCLRLHDMAQGGTSGDAGQWKSTQNDIIQICPFGIADVERRCPNVSRDTIRLVMNRWREQGRLEMLGKGRDAKWRRKGEK